MKTFPFQRTRPNGALAGDLSSNTLPARPDGQRNLAAQGTCDYAESLGHEVRSEWSMDPESFNIAVEEIEACAVRHPRQASRIREAIDRLVPPSILSEFSSDFYRAHARELIQRVAFKTSLGPGTRAEVLAALCSRAIDKPLSRAETFLVYQNLWHVLPDQLNALLADAPRPRPTAEEYLSMLELEAKLRRQLGRARTATQGPGGRPGLNACREKFDCQHDSIGQPVLP